MPRNFLALWPRKCDISNRFCRAERHPASQNASIPWPRCQPKCLNGQLRPCEGRYRSWLSWIDTNPELSLGATGRSGRSSEGDRLEIADQETTRHLNKENQLAEASQLAVESD